MQEWVDDWVMTQVSNMPKKVPYTDNGGSMIREAI